MMKKICYLLLLPLLAAPGFSQVLTAPFSNLPSGVYTTEQVVSLLHDKGGVSIFYTLNGDEPTVSDHLYTGPINMLHLGDGPDVISLIPTNPNLTYPYGTYNEVRANSRGWVPPYANGYNVNVIRYKAFKPGYAPSETVTQTFIIDPEGAMRYNGKPIVSVTIDNSDLFSGEKGIYVYGDNPDGNYLQKGVEWERMMSFEYFDEKGDLAISRNCRTRIHGGGSRHAPKKSFRIYGNTETEENFNYGFFDDTELKKFKRILLKGGGHRPDCFPRDDLSNMITKGLNVEQQHFKHVIVFLNGEYWGIHSIKERMDAYFIQNSYGIDDNNITMLDQEYDIQGTGHSADSAEMKNLESFIIVNDMSLPANYRHATDRMDMDNYIDYMCAEIFLSNEDWVYSNVNIWRKNGPFDPSKPAGHDGKFRWALYDLDGAFGGSCAHAYYTVNTLAAATIESGEFSSYSRLFRGLLDNPDFRRDFINRMSDLSNSWFRPAVLHHKIDSIYGMITPEVEENMVRWRYPSFASTLVERYDEAPSIGRWNELFGLLHTFANRRGAKVREHMMEKWGYTDTSQLTVTVNDMTMGRVKVNTILINKNLPGVDDNIYPWNGWYMDDVTLPLVAIPLPGYRFVEWLETGSTEDTLYWTPSEDITYTAVFEEDDDYSPILINELMPSNKNYLTDNFGEADDWLELYNPNNYTVNLSGSKLRKDGKDWTIPNGTTIAANDYLLFWPDKETYQGINHTNFKLSNIIDTIYLLSPSGTEIDFLRYPNTPSNYSYGRYPNGSTTFAQFSSPTPIANNDFSGTEEAIIITTPLVAFPNPSAAIVYLNKVSNFRLFDLKGAEVMRYNNVNQFDVSSLEKGLYILQTDELETLKIIVK